MTQVLKNIKSALHGYRTIHDPMSMVDVNISTTVANNAANRQTVYLAELKLSMKYVVTDDLAKFSTEVFNEAMGVPTYITNAFANVLYRDIEILAQDIRLDMMAMPQPAHDATMNKLNAIIAMCRGEYN